jgi:hypothetical protein
MVDHLSNHDPADEQGDDAQKSATNDVLQPPPADMDEDDVSPPHPDHRPLKKPLVAPTSPASTAA